METEKTEVEKMETEITETEKTEVEKQESTEEKPLTKKEKRRLKKEKWKAFKKSKKLERKNKRAKLKEDYACAPFLVKLFCVYRPVFFGIVAAFVLVLCVFGGVEAINETILDGKGISGLLSIIDGIANLNNDVRFMDIDMDKVYEQTPLDEEGAKRIAALEPNAADETWTFCIYMVGSNLESFNENDLNPFIKNVTGRTKDENTAAQKDNIYNRFIRYSEELASNNLDVPGYLYSVKKPLAASSTPVTTDVVLTSNEGFASTDLSEMFAVELPENVTVVIQTGGATRWSSAIINPNRTQRFIYKNGVFSEVANMSIKDSCAPDTLADYIDFCDDNYKSDHMALILWDHGSGAFGFGSDEIFGTSLSLAEMKEALSSVISKNETNPYYDFIGFDACLMGNIETASNFNGYAKYFVASEETEPGGGWDYYTWMGEFVENPTMNGAQIGQAIADSYMDFYTKKNVKFSNAITSAVTFSVVDISKATKAYEAYDALNEKILEDLAEDPTIMTNVSRAASNSIRYGASAYYAFNHIDLGMYMDYLSEFYPTECAKIKALLGDAVLYTRSNLNLTGSQGLSVYFPTAVEEANGVNKCLEYIYDISEMKSTNALYYYKIAGCLNPELYAHVMEVAGKTPKKLNTQIFYDYQKIMPEIKDEQTLIMNIDEELKENIQSVSLILANYNENSNRITYYGETNSCKFNDEGNLEGNISGTWYEFGGSLLDADISYTTDTTETYVTKILHNDVPSYLTFSVEKDTGDVDIVSIVPIPTNDTPGMYDAALRMTVALNSGDSITPLLTVDNPDTGDSVDVPGKTFRYRKDIKIKRENLPAGQYLASIIITDIRGDEYYSPVVECTIRNGKVSDTKINLNFIGD